MTKRNDEEIDTGMVKTAGTDCYPAAIFLFLTQFSFSLANLFDQPPPQCVFDRLLT